MMNTEHEIDAKDEIDASLDDHTLSDEYPDISISMAKEQFSAFELKRRAEDKKTLQIDPAFQREKTVWKEKQRSELIESILMGIPIPIIYLFENEKGIKQVVDGRQRLSCLFDFLNEKFKLKDLNILKKLNGKYFNQLDAHLQSKIEDYQLLSYTIQYPTKEKVKFDIFDRVNRSGTRLNNQEMRNALYLGKSTELLNKLVKMECFLKATARSINSTRMKDKYIVLRFLGTWLLNNDKTIELQYKSDMDEFLAKIMKLINHFETKKIETLVNLFKLSMQNCYHVLGENAFRFEDKNRKRPINMGLFESITYMLSIPLNNNNIILLRKEINDFKSKNKDNAFFKSSIDTLKGLEYRFNEANTIRNKIQQGAFK